MSFESQVDELAFETDGVTASFGLSSEAGALYFMNAADVRAFYIPADGEALPLTNGIDFTVSGDGRTGNGTLTPSDVLADGVLRAWCETPAVQPEQYQENDGFPAVTHERAQDRHQMAVRDQKRVGSRALRLADSAAPRDMTIDPDAMEGHAIVFRDGLPSPSSKTMAEIEGGALTSPIGIVTTIEDLRLLPMQSGYVGQLVYVRGGADTRDGDQRSYLVVSVNPGDDNGEDMIHSDTAGYYFVADEPSGTVQSGAKLVAAMSNGRGTHKIKLPNRSLTFSARLDFATNHETHLIGQGSGTQLLVPQGLALSKFISIQAMDNDSIRNQLRDFSVVVGDGSGTDASDSGHGIQVVDANSSGIIDGVRVSGINQAGCFAFKLTRSYIWDLSRILAANNTGGLMLEDVAGVTGRMGWLVNNGVGLQDTKGSRGNNIEFTEVGLGSVDATKQAYNLSGNLSRYHASFFENFSKWDTIRLNPESYEIHLTFDVADDCSAYDTGHFNVRPVAGGTKQVNLTSAWGFAGAHMGTGLMENRYPDSQWLTSAARWTQRDAGLSPAISVQAAGTGFADRNSLKLDFGTTKFAAAVCDLSVVMASGEHLGQWFQLCSNRDMADGEVILVVLRSTAPVADTAALTQRVVKLMAGEQRWIYVPYKGNAAETVHLEVGLRAVPTGGAFILYLTDMNVSLAKQTNRRDRFTNIINDLAGTFTRVRDNLFAAVHSAQRQYLELSSGAIGRVGGTLYANSDSAGTPASTAQTTLRSYVLKAKTARDKDDTIIVEANGLTDATADGKQAKIIIGATTIANTGMVVTGAAPWWLSARIMRNGQNLQKIHVRGEFGGAAFATVVTTSAEDLHTDLTIYLDGANAVARANALTVEGFAVRYEAKP